MEHKKLNEFGHMAIENIRDATIVDMLEIVFGKIKSPRRIDMHSRLMDADFNEIQINLLKEFVVKAVDSTIHNFLWTIEQEDELKLIYHNVDLEEISDGLCGDYVGFVDEFSRFPAVDDLDPDKIHL